MIPNIILDDNQMKQELMPVSHGESVVGLDLHLGQLNIVEKGVIASLTLQTDLEIRDTREKSKLVERFGWRIQCACDYEIRSRVIKLKGGRGNSDIENQGMNAALRRQAKKIGVTANTIRQNAKIYNLILDANKSGRFTCVSLDILDEKGFYLAALLTNDPINTLLVIAKKKTEAKRFRVSDAMRFIKSEKLTAKITSKAAVKTVRTASKNEIAKHLKEVEALLLNHPDTETFKRVFQDFLADVRDELGAIHDGDIVTALKRDCSPGCDTEQQLSIKTGFSVEDVRRILNYSEDDFDLIPNTIPQRWHKVGEPLPPELRNGKKT